MSQGLSAVGREQNTLSQCKDQTSLDDLFAIAAKTSDVKKRKKHSGMKSVKRLSYGKLNRRRPIFRAADSAVHTITHSLISLVKWYTLH